MNRKIISFLVIIFFFISCMKNTNSWEYRSSFSIIYCDETDCILSPYQVFFKGKIYAPRIAVSYKNSHMDSLYHMRALGEVGYSVPDMLSDTLFFSSFIEKYKIVPNEYVIFSNRIILDNGIKKTVEKVNNDYYYLKEQSLIIYSMSNYFTNSLVKILESDKYNEDESYPIF